MRARARSAGVLVADPQLSTEFRFGLPKSYETQHPRASSPRPPNPLAPVTPAMRQLLPHTPALLQLQTGHVFPGFSFGYAADDASTAGEAVFQTGMVGYPEALTDPSYAAQILVLTYPIVGNYGVPDMSALDSQSIPLHSESTRIHPAALVVAEYTHHYSHWNAACSLSDWLVSEKVPAITGVDTRHRNNFV